jgi:hypothetical protein
LDDFDFPTQKVSNKDTNVSLAFQQLSQSMISTLENLSKLDTDIYHIANEVPLFGMEGFLYLPPATEGKDLLFSLLAGSEAGMKLRRVNHGQATMLI